MKRILGLLLIVIGVLTYLFFRNYNGNILPYPTLWFFVGIILAIIGLRLFVTSKSQKQKSFESELYAQIDTLKQHGKVIIVNLKDCEIISSNYFKEIPKSNNYRIQAWDSILDSSNAVKNVEINQSRIVYKDKDEVYISSIINKDKVTLSFTIENYGQTNIYVDNNDKSLYYFDIEFLNERSRDEN